MSLLEDAVRVLTGNVSVHLVYDPERGATHICLHCPARVLFSDGRPFEHAPDCPTRSMPQVVAALESAERYVNALQADSGHGPIPGSYSGTYVDHERGIAYQREKREAEQALVAALKG